MGKSLGTATEVSVLFACVVAFLSYLLFLNLGLYPQVFSDEYTYSRFSRLSDFSESPIPSYLYLSIYSTVSYCGSGFLGCARLLNAIFFSLSIFFIFFVARKVTNFYFAITICILTMCGTLGGYTAYFMPESLYFLSFWFFVWYLLRINSDRRLEWVIAGAIYGLSSLVKPHALLIAPALLLYIFYSTYRDRLSTLRSLESIFLVLSTALAVKFGLGFLLAGKYGLTLFGPTYKSIATSGISAASSSQDTLLLALANLWGHILAISLLYGLPVVLCILAIGGKLQPTGDRPIEIQASSQLAKLGVLSLALMISLVAVTALFTASVSGAGPYESAFRLHMRYYSFIFPLLLIVAAGAASAEVVATKSLKTLSVTLPIALVAYATVTQLHPFVPGHVDSPDLQGIVFYPALFWVFSILVASSFLVWVFAPRAGILIYLFIATPIAVAVNTHALHSLQRIRLTADVFDKAGLFASQYLSDQELAQTKVIARDAAGLYRTLFHIDNAGTTLLLANTPDLDVSAVAPDTQWLLVLGDYNLVNAPSFLLQLNGFKLIKIPAATVLMFNTGEWPGVIAKSSGLSTPEQWGTWSDGKTIILTFADPLPERFRLTITGIAFGPNVGQDFNVTVGNENRLIKFSETGSSNQIDIFNPDGAKEILVTIPQPTSPAQLGQGQDQRQLGLGLVKLEINALP